jgi:hypothetical protein
VHTTRESNVIPKQCLAAGIANGLCESHELLFRKPARLLSDIQNRSQRLCRENNRKSAGWAYDWQLSEPDEEPTAGQSLSAAGTGASGAGDATFRLTKLPAAHVKPPLIAECFANLECHVIDRRLVNKYNLFILEVLKAWIDPTQRNPKTIHHRGYGTFVVDGQTIKLKSRMP